MRPEDPIETLSLSARADNALHRRGIASIGDLAECDLLYISAMPGVGAKTAEEIAAAVSRVRGGPLGSDEPVIPSDPVGTFEISDSIGPDTPLAWLDLSVRATNALKRAGLETVGELDAYGIERLSNTPQLGSKTLKEIALVLTNGDEVSPPVDPHQVEEREPEDYAIRIESCLDRLRTEGSEGPYADLAAECVEVAARIDPDDPSAPALARALSDVISSIPLRAIVIGFRRETETLDAVGVTLDLTRERVRTVEIKFRAMARDRIGRRASGLSDQWREELRSGVRSERELLQGSIDASLSYRLQRLMAHEVLKSIGAADVKVFDQKLKGWWTKDSAPLEAFMRSVASNAPFDDQTLEQQLRSAPVAQEFPFREVFQGAGSPLRLHSNGEVWVSVGCRNGDAAYYYLLEAGEPKSRAEIAAFLGVKEHATAESMRRDERFVPLRPSSDWSLREWKDVSQKYVTALEAGLAVLSELGRMPVEKYVALLIERYPVSQAAARNTLLDERIGRWPDGLVDLVERGAPPMEEPEPKKPEDVQWDEDAQRVTFDLKVNSELLRGSGIAIHSFITWTAGLRQATRAREFALGRDRILTIRRSCSGAAVSSMRDWAEANGAERGAAIRVELDLARDTAVVTILSQ